VPAPFAPWRFYLAKGHGQLFFDDAGRMALAGGRGGLATFVGASPGTLASLNKLVPVPKKHA
jgi:hypothetical protein